MNDEPQQRPTSTGTKLRWCGGPPRKAPAGLGQARARLRQSRRESGRARASAPAPGLCEGSEGKTVPGRSARVLKLQSSLSPRYRAGLPGA